eukprot:CAMPEP_0178958386 /NCGR_PEP_ID=MMETSP0789-20121207/11588_1 /TAXON_ID=3005 /ORGANISM="Rhizosolenia setigera, Strain CCMP 1694" /LENGTH=345 /DNA_ID=CAMNT_0020641035 /DNA_START=1 /DNA_END=1038 /DNA_ORIENTATION=-
MLEAGTKRLLQLISINMDCCEEEYEEIFTASDGNCHDKFGSSCSMSDDLIVIGARCVGGIWLFNNDGAAYLFNLDGTEVAKLTPGDSVAIDEKVVVGTGFDLNYVQVFSRNSTYERTIYCVECSSFGSNVATHGNLIVTNGAYGYTENFIYKLFIYSTEDGQLLKSLEGDFIYDVAMSEQFIVSTALNGKTFIYNNTSPDFAKIAEINQGGREVAVAGDRIVFGDATAKSYNGVAYLYKTDGTLVKTLDRQDASSDSWFGFSLAITDNKVIVGAYRDDDGGCMNGSIFIYSADTGDFIEKVVGPDGKRFNYFGSSVCASDSHYVVGAQGVDRNTGAAYLFQFSEE